MRRVSHILLINVLLGDLGPTDGLVGLLEREGLIGDFHTARAEIVV